MLGREIVRMDKSKAVKAGTQRYISRDLISAWPGVSNQRLEQRHQAATPHFSKATLSCQHRSCRVYHTRTAGFPLPHFTLTPSPSGTRAKSAQILTHTSADQVSCYSNVHRIKATNCSIHLDTSSGGSWQTGHTTSRAQEPFG